MVRRETNAAIVNALANHPDILPAFDLSGVGALDFGPCVASDDYRILSFGPNCVGFFEWSAPGVWECHTMFHPDVRGAQAIDAARQMCAWMFAEGASMLWGQTPTIMRPARWFNRKVGFKSAGIGFHHVCGEVERFVLRNTDGSAPRSSGRHLGSR